jgi:DNA (cytosine-5)-methyltransferase 1
MKTHVDLFSGCGGFSVAAEQMGYDTILAVDNNKDAAKLFKHNFPRSRVIVDTVSSVKSWPGGVYLVTGGPPCQAYSIANQRTSGGSNDKYFLYRDFLSAVGEMNPRHVVMENVMAIPDDVLLDVTTSLDSFGYNTTFFLVCASWYGVPQYRKRVFVVASRDAIGTLPEVQPEIPVRSVLTLPREYDKTIDHVGYTFSLFNKHVVRYIPPGGDYTYVPEELRRSSADKFKTKFFRLDPDRPSKTVVAHLQYDGNNFIHPEFDRTISVREAARIQTFPDSFEFPVRYKRAFQAIGNAVPPRLGATILSTLGG